MSAHIFQQDGMINGCEMLTNVTTQYVAIIPAKLLYAINGTMRAFADPIGITIWNKYMLKAWFNDGAKGMMHHSITKYSCTDLAAFGFMD